MMTFVPSSRESLYVVAEQRSGWLRASDAIKAGVSRQQLARYAESGVLHRSAHGVYRLRDFPAHPFEDVIEACLWAGADAVASHDTALAVYGLGDAMPTSIHITVPQRLRKGRTGVVVHVAAIGEAEVTSRDGVPVTSLVRTIQDIAGEATADVVVSLINDAETLGLFVAREAGALRNELGSPS